VSAKVEFETATVGRGAVSERSGQVAEARLQSFRDKPTISVAYGLGPWGVSQDVKSDVYA